MDNKVYRTEMHRIKSLASYPAQHTDFSEMPIQIKLITKHFLDKINIEFRIQI
jgi:hypothetical protein